MRHSIDLMFLYQAGAFAGSAAKAETSSRGRFISISVRTSTATSGVCHPGRPNRPPGWPAQCSTQLRMGAALAHLNTDSNAPMDLVPSQPLSLGRVTASRPAA